MTSVRNTVETTIPLIDPTSKGGLVQVPLSKTHDTKGRGEYLRGMLKKEVSLCCLFQRGRCNAAEKCHQIHVDTELMRGVREQQQHVVSCCRQCHDTYSASQPAVAFFAQHFPAATVRGVRLLVPPSGGAGGEAEAATAAIAPEQLAWTVGLQQYMENGHPHQPQQGVVYLPAKKVCRLHLRGACKYGKDCKNIHLCSKLGEGYLGNTSPTPSSRQFYTSHNGSASSPQPMMRHQPHTHTAKAPAAWAAGRQQQQTGRSTSLPSDSTSSLFDRMSDEPAVAHHTRTTSAPPPSAAAAATADAAAVGADRLCEATLERSGLGAQSRAMQLCFDPGLLAEACANADGNGRRMSNAAVDWDASFDGLSSTKSSARSAAPPQSAGFFDHVDEQRSHPWGRAPQW